ncbi:MAG: hypothetical protein ACLSGK_13455 [Lachnospiraceae bacterium]
MLCNYLQNVAAITYIFVLQLSTFLFYNKHNWGIGTEISSLSDCFWNRGRLEQDYPELSKVDVISIVKALEALSSYVTL